MLRKNGCKSIVSLSAAAALFVAGAVQAQVATPQPGVSTATASGASSLLAKSDQKVLMDLSQTNLTEIEAARLAHGKSENNEVRQFAQQMIDDHTKVLAEVRQLAQARGVALPADLDRSHKATIDKMAALSGADFDKAYLARAGVAEHKKVHGLLNQAALRTRDLELQALIARTLPVLDQDLASVEQLHKDTLRGSSKTQGSTGASPDKK